MDPNAELSPGSAFAVCPYDALRSGAEAPGSHDGEHPLTDEATVPSSRRVLRCRACGHLVARPTDRLSVRGHHDHVCINPHGHSFQIGCFRRANGTLPWGEPESHFTWFEGYLWQVVLCGGCRQHLGWRFQGEQGSFFGLITTRIEEGD